MEFRDWIHLVEECSQWQVFMHMVMNLKGSVREFVNCLRNCLSLKKGSAPWN
jgi:hypothetical protein